MPTDSIEAREQALVEDFALFEDDWEAKYQYIIDLGEAIPRIEAEYKTRDHLVPGCLSKVWLHAELKDDRVFYKADSESSLVRGLAAMLLEVLSGRPPHEIVAARLTFIEKTGLLKEHFTMQRKNGLQSLIKKMKGYALAFAETRPNGTLAS